MRRTLIGGSRRIRLGLLQPLAEFCDPPRQRVDLLPLRGDGLVQRLDRVVLIGEPRLQRVDALVEYEAFAAPATLSLRHLFQIFENAALEVIDLGKATCEQVRARLLAAD